MFFLKSAKAFSRVLPTLMITCGVTTTQAMDEQKTIMICGKEVAKNVTELDLSFATLMSFPSEIEQLTNLQKLDLEASQLTNIPSEIGQLPNLQKLNLGDNELRIVPREIGKMVNLKVLDLSENQLTNIPEEVSLLINLEKLYLFKNMIQNVPSAIGQLTNLKKLWLSNNQLTSIPDEIGQVTNLENLCFSNNQMTSLPMIALLKLTKLKKLNLTGNPLQGFYQNYARKLDKDGINCLASNYLEQIWHRPYGLLLLQGGADIASDFSILPNELAAGIIAKMGDKQ